MDFLNLYILALALMIFAGSAAVVYKLQYPKRKTYAYALATGLPTDPGELGFEAQERRYVFADGSTTLGWEITGQAPGGPVAKAEPAVRLGLGAGPIGRAWGVIGQRRGFPGRGDPWSAVGVGRRAG